MKKALLIALTVGVESILTWLIAKYFHVRFVEVMFFTGLAFTVIIFWFSSSGGAYTRFIDSQASAQTGVLMNRESLKWRLNPVLLGSIVFLTVGLLLFILLLKGIIPQA
ncbi:MULTISPECIES: hypothetical protein [unclassified Bacillus (in: firmicutes)]|uniref:hypothetical protein n=1 Tax=unclassified Bacillus (in: firmicutes) TaxID=185979 RepID=UPI0008EBCA6F|nr:MULTISPECIES: hypothetical protein [unclassified Bacillus (in: firmicutes)]SFA89279.1 hypothetical protein SAMN02799634_102383 [Bacillus sp. UNCCL13]SFQ84848.1 hypothetical protein SAMN04488577_2502 [Bacillus sp. cl95]